MKQIHETLYQANEGCFIVRKSDDFIMGESIDLGSADSIDNYEDIPFTEESYRDFYASVGESRLEVKEETFKRKED